MQTIPFSHRENDLFSGLLQNRALAKLQHYMEASLVLDLLDFLIGGSPNAYFFAWM